MCGGAHFQYGEEYMRMYFPNPKAMLPVLKKDGSIVSYCLGDGDKSSQVFYLSAAGQELNLFMAACGSDISPSW